ncbi:MAG: hypothetical protein ACXVJ7_08010 [Acidimicrobiia bacterium]
MDDALPKVTLRMLARAEQLCPRQLALDHDGQDGNRPASRRYRVAGQVEADARLAHTALTRPAPEHFRPTDDLEPEEQRVYEMAAAWYVALFGDQAMSTADTATDDFETVAARTGVRLVGPAGLALEDGVGGRELRLLSFGTERPEEIVDAPSTRFALLRRARWTMQGPLRVVRADLLAGWAAAIDLDGAASWDALRSWLAERVDTVRAHADKRSPQPGWECARCRYIAGCSALR